METNLSTELTETLACPLCGADRFTVMKPSNYPIGLTHDNIVKIYSASSDRGLFDQLVKCRECSLVYLNPRIKAEFILESYSRAVDPTFIQQNSQRIKTFKRILNRLIHRFSLKTDGRLVTLDIGCAGGAFPKAASDCGFKVVGVEPSVWLSEQARNLYGLDIRTGTLLAQDFCEKSFDLITLWDVIEHLTNPGQIVEKIHQLLKDEGIFIVNYPDYSSFARKLLGNNWPFFLSVHLIYFTPQTITNFLGKYGFEVIEIRSHWQTLEFGYVLQRAAVNFKVFGPVVDFVKLLKMDKLPMTYNVGQSLLVARKK